MVWADVPKFLGIFWGECCCGENGNCIFGRMAKILLFFRRIVLSGDYKNLFSPPICSRCATALKGKAASTHWY